MQVTIDGITEAFEGIPKERQKQAIARAKELLEKEAQQSQIKEVAMSLLEFHPQYITNENGEKTAVILPIQEYEELLEDIECLKIVRSRLDEPTIPHEEVVRGLT